MSVYVVALTDPDLYLSPGDRVPDGVGAYVQHCVNEAGAWDWILSPERPTYYAGDEEAILVVTSENGVVL